MRRRTVLRALRFALLLFVVLVLAWFVRGYEWHEIQAADSSLEPAHARGSRVLVRRIDPEDRLARGDDVVYAMERDGVRYARFGRVRALAGDVVGEDGGKLTVNGETIGPIAVRGKAMGRVPEGHVVILATGPVDAFYPDSRALGFVPREDVQGIIVLGLG